MPTREPRFLSKILTLITDVRPGEAVTALLLTLNVFLLLAAYYLIKPVREALILGQDSGAEYKAYMSGAIAVALLIAVPAYARFADRVPRLKLVVGVSLFFASHLVVFFLAGSGAGLGLALGFYLWVGIFNMMVVAQFWSFANDIYSEEQGKRLFPLVALGASVGAAAGSKLSETMIHILGVFPLLLVGAGVLVACAALFWAVEVRERDRVNSSPSAARSVPPAEGGHAGAFALVFSNRYLLGLALFALVFSAVNTNGEYLLGKLVKNAANEAVNRGELARGDQGAFIGAIYGEFFFYVNILGMLLQAFVVSRLVRWLGIGKSLFILPFIALGDALFVFALPLLSVIRVGKAVENATDYSLNNTLRQMLWLVTTREQKYKAKQAVDTFFVRIGDVGSALLVWVTITVLGLGVREFALVNAVLAATWIAVTILIVREHRRLTSKARDYPEGRSSPAS